MRLVVSHEQQLVRRSEAVLPAMQLPGGNLASAGEQLDLRDIEFIALPRLAAPDQALALQVAEMRSRGSTGPELVLRHEQIIAHRSHQRSQDVFEGIEQGILAVASFFPIQDGEDVMDGRAGDPVAQQALEEGNECLT